MLCRYNLGQIAVGDYVKQASLHFVMVSVIHGRELLSAIGQKVLCTRARILFGCWPCCTHDDAISEPCQGESISP